MKHCTKCGELKPLSAFSKHRLTKDGHAYQCKACNTKRNNEYQKTPAGIYSQINGRSKYNQRTKKRYPKPVNVSKEDFIEWYENTPKVCVYCDIPEDKVGVIQEAFDRHVSRLEIDCVENARGYELGNMVLACHRCNFIKLNIFSFDEMREIGQKYIKPKWKMGV